MKSMRMGTSSDNSVLQKTLFKLTACKKGILALGVMFLYLLLFNGFSTGGNFSFDLEFFYILYLYTSIFDAILYF